MSKNEKGGKKLSSSDVIKISPTMVREGFSRKDSASKCNKSHSVTASRGTNPIKKK